jgi:3-oxoadipate enol-lactonase
MFMRDTGSGDAVLLLHGSPSAPTDFLPLVERLSRTRRVLVPDMPGYGASPFEPGLSLARSIELIDAQLAARGVDEVAVVGFSLGAWRALLLALDGKTRVDSIVALGGHAGVEGEGRETLRFFADLVRNLPSLRHPEIEPFMPQRMLSPADVATHPEHVAAVIAWLDWPTPAALAAELDAVVNATPVYDRLGELCIPLLARVGALDATAPPEISRRIVEAVKGARLEIVEGKGHALLVEDTEPTVASITSFLGA